MEPKYMELAAPLVGYWMPSLYYELLTAWNTAFIQSKRLTLGDEKVRNKISRRAVVLQVASYQVI